MACNSTLVYKKKYILSIGNSHITKKKNLPTINIKKEFHDHAEELKEQNLLPNYALQNKQI